MVRVHFICLAYLAWILSMQCSYLHGDPRTSQLRAVLRSCSGVDRPSRRCVRMPDMGSRRLMDTARSSQIVILKEGEVWYGSIQHSRCCLLDSNTATGRPETCPQASARGRANSGTLACGKLAPLSNFGRPALGSERDPAVQFGGPLLNSETHPAVKVWSPILVSETAPRNHFWYPILGSENGTIFGTENGPRSSPPLAGDEESLEATNFWYPKTVSFSDPKIGDQKLTAGFVFRVQK